VIIANEYRYNSFIAVVAAAARDIWRRKA